jgi:hypothetical protein
MRPADSSLERCDAKRSREGIAGGLLAQDDRGKGNAVHKRDYFRVPVQDFSQMAAGF